jgi:hypothetical protein
MANTENGRSITAVLHEFRDELKEFAQLRIQLLRSEMQKKVDAWKGALPMLVIGAVVGVLASLVMTAFVVFAIAALLNDASEYPMVWATLIVGLLYLLIAGSVGYAGYKRLTAEKLAPERTIRVLQEDQLWIQNEARLQS